MKKQSIANISIALFVIFSVFILPGCTQDIEEQFEEKFREWENARIEDARQFKRFPGHNKLEGIRKLGIPVTPYLIGKLKGNTHDIPMISSFTNIIKYNTGKQLYNRSYFKDKLPPGEFEKKLVDFYDEWWNHGRRNTHKEFEEACVEWKKLKEEGTEKEIESALYKIRCMGTIALPLLIEKIKQGDTELMSILPFWLKNDSLKTASLEECIEWCEKNREKWYIEIPKDDEAEAKQN